MKTTLKQLAAVTVLSFLAVSATHAAPIVLPDPAAPVNATGTFSVVDNQIKLQGGTPINLITSSTKGDVASGSARFMSGELHYDDGTSQVDGQMAKVTFGKQDGQNGQTTYILKGLVYGKLTQGGQTADVNGNFSVVTKPAADLASAQVDSANLILTVRSNINNTESASHIQHPQRSHDAKQQKPAKTKQSTH